MGHEKMKSEEKIAIEFVEWVYKERFVKYWGSDEPYCGKWYKQYTPPTRQYYSTEELFQQFKKQ